MISDDCWFTENTYNFGTGPTNAYIADNTLCTNSVSALELMYMDYVNSSGSGTIDCSSVTVTAPGSHPNYVCIHDENPVQTEADKIFWVSQYNGGSTPKIVYKFVQPQIMADIEYAATQGYIDDGTNPCVGGMGSNVCVVYMNAGNLLAQYSTDNGVTFKKSTIGPGEYPAVVFMDATNVSCAYEQGGNLFLVNSTDGGATWKTPQQINDGGATVVGEENAIDIHYAGIVWEDTRNGGQKDIYFHPFVHGVAPNTPSTPTGNAKGNVGTAYTYATSATHPNGEQVYYKWDWGDGTQSTWLGPFNSGAQASAQKTWSAKGTYSIKVKAKVAKGAESPWSPPLPVTMPFSYNIKAPFWAQLFERFPHAFPILRHLLGY
jgi:hypothetical protein